MSAPARPDDPRAAAFCSPAPSEVFQAVAYRSDIGKEDPYDVESIHEEARRFAFQRASSVGPRVRRTAASSCFWARPGAARRT